MTKRTRSLDSNRSVGSAKPTGGMMVRIGDKLRSGRVDAGVQGKQIAPESIPQDASVVFNDFSLGIINAVPQEKLDPRATPDAGFVELLEDGAIAAAKGINWLSDGTAHSYRYGFENT